MITKEQFEQAKQGLTEYQKIIDDYKLQERNEAKREQDEREANCKDHEYRSSGGKWSSATQMRCIHCGRTIG